MSTSVQSEKGPSSTTVHVTKPSETSAESRSARSEPQRGSAPGLSEVMDQFSRDVAGLKDSLRNVSQTVASQIGSTTSDMMDTGSDLASSAKERAKTFASELESMARRNPLGTIAGALLVGVVIGMMSRGRS